MIALMYTIIRVEIFKIFQVILKRIETRSYLYPFKFEN